MEESATARPWSQSEMRDDLSLTSGEDVIGTDLIVSPGGSDELANILLATTIDGAVHGLDKETGRILWSSTDLGGSLLKGATPMVNPESEDPSESWALSRDPSFLIEPLFPGSLYLYVPGDTLQVYCSFVTSYVYVCVLEDAHFDQEPGEPVSGSMGRWDGVPGAEDHRVLWTGCEDRQDCLQAW